MREFAAKVKRWYVLGLWTEQMVRAAVAQNKLNGEEFKAITGKGLLG